MPKCSKHPNTDLVMRRGKRGAYFVVCPDCKPENGTAPAAKPAAAEPEKKKGDAPETGTGKPWYDRQIFG